MAKNNVGLLLIWIISTWQVKGNDPCVEHCICDDTNTTCMECEMWYVRNEQGKCGQYIEKVFLKSNSTIRSGEIGSISLGIQFYRSDLHISPFTEDYYYYSVQYRLLNSEDDFRDQSFVKHFNGLQGWINFTANVLDGISYELRIAFYRRFALRGWEDFLDATVSLVMTSKSYVRHQFGEYEYLFSGWNGIPVKRFPDAKKFCHKHNGDLASITSLAESQFLSSYYTGWIGLHVPGAGPHTSGCDTCDECAEAAVQADNPNCTQCAICRDKWRWTDGQWVRITFWMSREPNNNHKCARIIGRQWQDYQCYYRWHFICKRAFRNATGSTTATALTNTSATTPVKSTPSASSAVGSTATIEPAISSTTSKATTVVSTTLTTATTTGTLYSSMKTAVTDTENYTGISTAKSVAVDTHSSIAATLTKAIPKTAATSTATNSAFVTKSSSMSVAMSLDSFESASKFGWQMIVGIVAGFGVLLITVGFAVTCYMRKVRKDLKMLKKQAQNTDERRESSETNTPMSGYQHTVNGTYESAEHIATGYVNERMSEGNQYQDLYS